jgi:excisionase family DNA binding protein
MVVSVADMARVRGVSPRRVLQLIHAGEIRADKVGGRFVIDEAELAKRGLRGRPMSRRMAWAFVRLLSGDDPQVTNATERVRLKQRFEQLAGDEMPAQLLATWLRRRADRVTLNVPPAALNDLRADGRVVASGVSDARAGLAAAHQFEGYVRSDDFEPLVKDYLLVTSDTPNVFLHVSEVEVPESALLGMVLADLSEHNGPREDAQVERMLSQLPEVVG